MRDRFNRFMQGRYGVDDLSKGMMYAAVVCMILNLFIRNSLLNTLVIVALILIYVRMFSTNFQRRYEENRKYQEWIGKVKRTLGIKGNGGIRGFMETQKRRAQDRKVNHIYKCPSCGQKIRIPKGKGHIMVTCPKCKTEFAKNS